MAQGGDVGKSASQYTNCS